jgi:hypothetical protein
VNKEKYNAVIQAVKQYVEQHRNRPTVMEICELTGIKSTSQVLGLMMIAVEQGDLIEDGERGTSRRIGVK